MSRRNRRQFLEDSMLAAAAAAAGSSAPYLLAQDAPQSSSANERLAVAVVGANGRRTSHAGAVEVARKYKRICQTGTQCRSNPGMRQFMEYVQSGKIGEVKVGRGLCYKRRESIGPKGNYPIPPEINYDLWSGPAPILPLTRP